MSMLHVIVLYSISDNLEFIDFYAKFARPVNVIFLVLANLGLILGFALSLIYRQKSKVKTSWLDNERHEFRKKYIWSAVISSIIFFCWILLMTLPYYTIQLTYKDPAEIEEDSVNLMKIIYLIANASVIFAFFTQMCISQQGPSDEEMEPLSDDDGIDTSEEEDDDEYDENETEM